MLITESINVYFHKHTTCQKASGAMAVLVLCGLMMLGVMAASCSHRSQTSMQIDQAYEYWEKDEFTRGKQIIDSLLASADVAGMEDYDNAYLGLAVMMFGTEVDDIEMGTKGYNMASKAYTSNPAICEKVVAEASYFKDEQLNYQEILQAAAIVLNDLRLKEKAINEWSTQWTDMMLGERRNVDEMLVLQEDGTFIEYSTFWIKETEGDYEYKAKANIKSGGQWDIEGGIITMTYEMQYFTTKVTDFKMYLSDAGFWGGDWFEKAITASISEKQVLENLRQELYNAAYIAYEGETCTAEIRFNNTNMIFESPSRKRVYTLVQD